MVCGPVVVGPDGVGVGVGTLWPVTLRRVMLVSV
jgi:hypothetical protein